MVKIRFLEAVATMTGCIIGAGVLGIPYVVAKAGFFTGLLNIIVLGVVILILYLFLGEITLRTKGNHQLAGYAERYLGKKGKLILTLTMTFGIYGALLAYLIMEGPLLNALLSPIFGGSPMIYSLIFFVIASYVIYKGLTLVEESDLIVAFAIFGVIILISIFGFTSINPAHLTGLHATKLFVPYGVVLFAFLGMVAVPEMKEELVNHKKDLKNAIIVGSLIPLAIYVVFALIVVGVTGPATTEDAILGLANALGYKMLITGTIFGIFAMATSFITLGLALKELFVFDYKLHKPLAWALVCFVPLILFLLNVGNFIAVLGIVGSIGGGLEGVLVVAMYHKAKKLGNRKPEYSFKKTKLLSWAVTIVFVLGIIFQVRSFLF